jgi:uncharacterized membrane protein (GlpM family)
LRPGWISHAKWTTASAPRTIGTKSELVMLAVAKVVRGYERCAGRRATATTSSTAASSLSASSRLVPTFPVPPKITTRTRSLYPETCSSTPSGYRNARLSQLVARLAGVHPDRGHVHDVLILAIKALAGGTLVVGFALLSEALSPKRFAGLFSAAPAVAITGLTVMVLDKGAHEAHENAVGMIAGSAGMAAYACACVPLLRRMKAVRAAAGALGAWIAAAALVSLPIFLA